LEEFQEGGKRMLKGLKTDVKRLAKGRYLVTVKASDTGRGKLKTTYDNEGIVVDDQAEAMELLAKETAIAAKHVANLTLPLPFKKDKKEKPAG